MTRPAIAEQRLSQASNGKVIVALKTPYDDGTSHVVLSPMAFMGRLAAWVPKPRVNLTRFHGVFSPNSQLREFVVPTKSADDQEQVYQPLNKAYSMAWAQRLKQVFAIEIEKCEKCGGNAGGRPVRSSPVSRTQMSLRKYRSIPGWMRPHRPGTVHRLRVGSPS
ncbi:MAG: transposase [Arenicellales bacterium WSBS_2016_MAG_OTU3]